MCRISIRQRAITKAVRTIRLSEVAAHLFPIDRSMAMQEVRVMVKAVGASRLPEAATQSLPTRQGVMGTAGAVVPRPVVVGDLIQAPGGLTVTEGRDPTLPVRDRPMGVARHGG